MVNTIVELRENGEHIQYEIDLIHLEEYRNKTNRGFADAMSQGMITGQIKEGNYEDEVDSYNSNMKFIKTVKEHGIKIKGDSHDYEIYLNVDSIIESQPKILGPTMHG
ncbi:MAG: hypothetical protein KJ906_04240 [Nanoarchaeota archaeon]|nr:hypothetical protein [Nanoarchaeota archaeon]